VTDAPKLRRTNVSGFANPQRAAVCLTFATGHFEADSTLPGCVSQTTDRQPSLVVRKKFVGIAEKYRYRKTDETRSIVDEEWAVNEFVNKFGSNQPSPKITSLA
jgi:hypothetical protein